MRPATMPRKGKFSSQDGKAAGERHSLSVLVVGASETGKSSFVANVQGGKFMPEHFPTIVTSCRKATFVEDKGVHLKRPVDLYDTPSWALGANDSIWQKKDAIVFVFDCSRPESAQELLHHWLNVARYHKEQNTVFLFLGTKLDLVYDSNGPNGKAVKDLEDKLEHAGLPHLIGSNKKLTFGHDAMKLLFKQHQALLIEGTRHYDPPLLKSLPPVHLPQEFTNPTLRKALGISPGEKSRDPKGSPSPIGTPLVPNVDVVDSSIKGSPDPKQVARDDSGDEVQATPDAPPEKEVSTVPRVGTEKSLCGMRRECCLRRAAIRISTNNSFNNLVLFLILLNCTTFILEDPPLVAQYPILSEKVLPYCSTFFTVAFIIEATIQITALGFFWGKGAYLKSGWNVIDFICVCSSIIGLLPFVPGAATKLTFLRTLRPLRAVNKFPALQFVMNSLLASIPMLVNVLILCAFFFVIFGLIGVQLFGGKLRPWHCISTADGSFLLDDEQLAAVEGPAGSCSTDPMAELPGCPKGYECKPIGENPNYGYTSFDNIGSAVLVLFMQMTIEAWGDTMYVVEDSTSYVANIYFVVVVFVGGLFLINMVVAVIFVTFKTQKDKSMYGSGDDSAAQSNGGITDTRNLKAARSGSMTRWQALMQANALREEALKAEEEKEAKKMQIEGAEVLLTEAFTQKRKANQQIGQRINDEVVRSIDGVKSSLTKHKDENSLVEVLEQCRNIQTAIQLGRADYLAENRGVKRDNWRVQIWLCVEGKFFQNVITMVIVANSIVMGIDHHDMAESDQAMMDLINQGFLLVFTVEFVLKFVALGPAKYCSEKFNIFDGVVTVVSIAENFLTGGGVLSVFRLLRIFRLFRLARAFPKFRSMLLKIVRTLPKISATAIVLMLTTFITSIAGRAGFAGLMDFECEEKPRHHFDKIYWALITNFQLLTGENWPTVLFDTMRAGSSPAFGAIYCISCLIINMYFVLSLFLATLIDEFQDDSQDEDDSDGQPEEGELKRQNDKDQLEDPLSSSAVMPAEGELAALQGAQLRKSQTLMSRNMPEEAAPELLGRSLFILGRKNPVRLALYTFIKNKWFDNFFIVGIIIISGILLALDGPIDDTYSPKKNPTIKLISTVILVVFTIEAVLKIVVYGLILHKGSYLRDSWNQLDALSVCFAWMEVLLPDFPSFLKAFRSIRALRPLRMVQRLPTLKAAINATFTSIPASARVIAVLWVFISIFAICGVQLFKGGFSQCTDECVMYREDCTGYFNPDIAFVDPQCPEDDGRRLHAGKAGKHDIFPFAQPKQQKSFIHVFHARGRQNGHTIQPQRHLTGQLTGDDTDKQTVAWPHWPTPSSCYKSWDDLSVDEIEAAWILGYTSAIWDRMLNTHAGGVRPRGPRWLNMTDRERSAAETLGWVRGAWDGVPASYKRSVEICPDLEIGCRLDRTVSADDPGAIPRIWFRLPYNFDNYLYAMLSLYEVATLEGWVDIMYRANDIVGPDLGPCRDASEHFAIFFVIYIFVCSFFALNLFMSVVIENFDNQLRAGAVDPRQRHFILHMKKLFTKHWLRPLQLPQSYAAIYVRTHFAQNKNFENFISFLIVANLVFMCTYTAVWDPFADFREPVDVLLFGIFVLEAALKLFALQGTYFDDPWNTFDIIVVSLSALALAANSVFPGFPSEFFLIVKIMRSFRVAKLLKRSKGVGVIVKSVLSSLPNVVNITILLGLCFFVYSLAGMSLYGKIPAGFILGKSMNFRNFPRSVLTLYYLATGEYWNGMMHDIFEPPACFPTASVLLRDAGIEWTSEVCENDLIVDGSCCPPGMWNRRNYSAIFFFLTYMLLANFILLNVVIGIVLDSFAESSEESDGIWIDDYDKFQEAWFELDFAHTRFMHVSLLSRMFAKLPEYPFKMMKSEAGDWFKVSDRVLLLNLHVGVLPGDVVQMSTVWLSLLYVHHPNIIPEEEMDLYFQKGYQALADESNLTIDSFADENGEPEMLFLDMLLDVCFLQYLYRTRIAPRSKRPNALTEPGVCSWYLSGHFKQFGDIHNDPRNKVKQHTVIWGIYFASYLDAMMKLREARKQYREKEHENDIPAKQIDQRTPAMLSRRATQVWMEQVGKDANPVFSAAILDAVLIARLLEALPSTVGAVPP